MIGQHHPNPLPLVFHPRVMEKLLRSCGRDMLIPESTGVRIGARVASEAVNIVDDPGLDGLITSRGFDDLGQRSHRLALVLKGKVVRYLSRVSVGGGHHWRRPDGHVGLGFSSLLMNRGEVGFHRLLADRPWQLLINKIGDIERQGPDGGRFVAPIQWGGFH